MTEGYVVVIRPERQRTYKVKKPPTLRRLQKLVAGYIEPVPNWNDFHTTEEGKSGFKPAFVFCNEEGKMRGLPYNPLATDLWKAHTGMHNDELVGPVVALVGSKKFLKEWNNQ
jgi:hypothetical protein